MLVRALLAPLSSFVLIDCQIPDIFGWRTPLVAVRVSALGIALGSRMAPLGWYRAEAQIASAPPLRTHAGTATARGS